MNFCRASDYLHSLCDLSELPMLSRVSRETLFGTIDEDLVQLLTVKLRFLAFLPLLLITMLFLLLYNHLEITGRVLAKRHAELVLHFSRGENLSNGFDWPI